MSNAPSTLDTQRVTGSADESTSSHTELARSLRKTATNQFRFAGFWSAVLLPLAYVPMLIGGVAGSQPSLVAALMALHAAALVAGHDYRKD
ncbi:hypothetical protein [Halorussus litoreus]|uniref:hypothetical protein n=1 Tax=Halorussus litoreus TaxID=1710536 RepID=UPI000E236477|nr:hypothetical protein [Halorussus litoreus]